MYVSTVCILLIVWLERHVGMRQKSLKPNSWMHALRETLRRISHILLDSEWVRLQGADRD